jgi:sortase (surface protein transpeptidase)
MKSTLVIIFLALTLGIGGGIFYFHNLRQASLVVPNAIGQSVVQPTALPQVMGAASSDQTLKGIPKYLTISKININSAVESVGLDSQGRMDVPKGADNVGWYNLGAKPGQKGNVVFDGHLDKATGEPAVFWNLKKVLPGDTIAVSDDQGQRYTYKVTQTKSYPWDNFPLQDVFGPTDKSRLNLITCSGAWDKQTQNYSTRTVVYSELIP